MKELIVLLTHVWGNQLDELYNDLSSCKHTIILADKNSKHIHKYPKNNSNLIFFDGNDKSYNQFHHISNNHLFFNIFNPLFQIMDTLRGYDRFWIVESDVRYNGDWNDFFNRMDNENCDLMLSWYNSYKNAPYYFWWPNNAHNYEIQNYSNNIANKSLLNTPKETWRKGLFCISRISLPLMEVLYKEMPNYNEYFECLVPTIANNYGYTIKNLNKRNILSYEYTWTPKNGYVEDNKIHHACKITDSNIPDEVLRLYDSINNESDILLKAFAKIQYKKYLNSLWIKSYKIHDEINDLISNFTIESVDFYNDLKYLIYLDKHILIPQRIFDKFLTETCVENVGEYLNYLTYYINKFGRNNKIIQICEKLLQNQIYSLSTQHKAYIKDELEILKHNNICNRLVDRILVKIQGVPEPNILYKKIDGLCGEFLQTMNTEFNYKYYPF
jgi:hypothetical protein